MVQALLLEAAVVGLLVVAAVVIGFFFAGPDTQFEAAASSMQNVFNKSWIPSFNIYYFMGVDGISLPLVILTALVSVLAMAASWSVTSRVFSGTANHSASRRLGSTAVTRSVRISSSSMTRIVLSAIGPNLRLNDVHHPGHGRRHGVRQHRRAAR